MSVARRMWSDGGWNGGTRNCSGAHQLQMKERREATRDVLRPRPPAARGTGVSSAPRPKHTLKQAITRPPSMAADRASGSLPRPPPPSAPAIPF
eukprot:365932-Chlamydomonas_euryale.AAC.1